MCLWCINDWRLDEVLWLSGALSMYLPGPMLTKFKPPYAGLMAVVVLLTDTIFTWPITNTLYIYIHYMSYIISHFNSLASGNLNKIADDLSYWWLCLVWRSLSNDLMIFFSWLCKSITGSTSNWLPQSWKNALKFESIASTMQSSDHNKFGACYNNIAVTSVSCENVEAIGWFEYEWEKNERFN